MPIVTTPHPDVDLIEFQVEGTVTAEDLERVKPAVTAFASSRACIDVIERIEAFDGIEAQALWDALRLDAELMHKLRRAAIVSDVEGADCLTETADEAIEAELRHFPLAEASAAQAWIRHERTS
ncbi:MAG: SpoIIAA family protein [Shimia sp.]